MIRISDLARREVVNVNDGKRLGLIGDLELDLELGTVKALIIPPAGHIWGKIVRVKDYIIPWEKIVKIGIDTVLVDFPLDSYGYGRGQ
ncbi:MAG TPA: YlmC/YmxH family sporulation protein [Firmicutes bacterium]|nr:YlmC/YmxH family sporulation protein [Bacillota bacterium]